MQILNLTQHEINVYKNGVLAVSYPPSGNVARIQVARKSTDSGLGFDFHDSIPGEVQDLPEPQDGVMLIVSLAVRANLPGRKDLLSPGPLLRDEKGQPIGAEGLDRNLQD